MYNLSQAHWTFLYFYHYFLIYQFIGRLSMESIKYLLKKYIVYKIVWRKALWHDKIVGAFPDKHLEAVKMRSTYVLYKQFVGRATKLSQNVFQV